MKDLTKEEAAKLQQRLDEDALNLSYIECQQLDRFVKTYSLKMFENVLRNSIKHKILRDFLRDLMRIHYGSMEVDDILRHFHCYPNLVTSCRKEGVNDNVKAE